jgi:hypothetical protein
MFSDSACKLQVSRVQRRGGQTGVAGSFRDEEHVFQDHAVFVKELVEAGGKTGLGSHG